MQRPTGLAIDAFALAGCVDGGGAIILVYILIAFGCRSSHCTPGAAVAGSHVAAGTNTTQITACDAAPGAELQAQLRHSSALQLLAAQIRRQASDFEAILSPQ